MKPVREVVSRDVIEDLWGEGYTIVPRSRHPDPFYVSPEMIPPGKAYQWWHLVHDKVHFVGKWAAVDASRHDGYFMPAGHVGNIEVQGMGLFEKSKSAVDAHHAEVQARSHKLVADWAEKAAADGLSGGFSVGGVGSEVGTHDAVKDYSAKTIETRVKLPPEMFQYAGKIFEERDRLYLELQDAWDKGGGTLTDRQDLVLRQYDAALKADPTILKGPTLNALLLPYAIQNVRERLVTPYQPPTE